VKPSPALALAVLAPLLLSPVQDPPVMARTTGATDPVSIQAVTLNVHHQNPQSEQNADIRHAAAMGGVIGWQEVSGRSFATIAHLRGFRTYFPRTDGGKRYESPISWRSDTWVRLEAGSRRTHGGLEHVSPPRYVTWVGLRRRDTGFRLAVIDNHLIAHGWCHHFPRLKEQILQRWHHHIAVLRTAMAGLRDRGYTVLVLGDFNRNDYPVLGDTVHYDLPWNVVTNGARQHYDYLMHTGGRLQRSGYVIDRSVSSHHAAVRVSYTE
jgi:endonuclease/exonuclease/phosphatase family metal-dependent hydrolase